MTGGRELLGAQQEESPLLELRGVRLSRHGVEILGGLDWTVRAGERWVILGPNGCGKSTLLKVILGYEWPGEGKVRVLGKTYGDGASIPELRCQLGWVAGHLDRDLDSSMTVLEVICCGVRAALAVHGGWPDSVTDQARHLIREVGLAKLEQRFYGNLSSGERQRVMLARALMAQPSVLLLDEPCAGLDPGAREDFLRALSSTGGPAGPTVVHVTHHVEEVSADFSHGLMMARGKVLVAGPVEEVLTSETLSQLYERPVRLHGTRNRGWQLEVERGPYRGFWPVSEGESNP